MSDPYSGTTQGLSDSNSCFSVQEVKQRLDKTCNLHYGSLILSCGSGATAARMLRECDNNSTSQWTTGEAPI